MSRSSERELAVIRRAYAAQVMAEAGVRSASVERAFAAVPREHFLGRVPWHVLRWGRGCLFPHALRHRREALEMRKR